MAFGRILYSFQIWISKTTERRTVEIYSDNGRDKGLGRTKIRDTRET